MEIKVEISYSHSVWVHKNTSNHFTLDSTGKQKQLFNKKAMFNISNNVNNKKKRKRQERD